MTIRFTYNKQSAEILSITELTLDQNSHTVRGDVDANGKFEIADLVLLHKWVLAVPDTYLANWEAGDFSGDGRLNAIDLSMMKNALMKQ
ncbi:MAG: dockerin type I repeat-containing protein [Oscillospiraceae bacterium]|nr:dockerin type I repeat-containing protein [Oscillospiraceae bacterium]